MSYVDLSTEEKIVLAVEFVGRDADIPQELRRELDPALLSDILHPETNIGNQKR